MFPCVVPGALVRHGLTELPVCPGDRLVQMHQQVVLGAIRRRLAGVAGVVTL